MRTVIPWPEPPRRPPDLNVGGEHHEDEEEGLPGKKRVQEDSCSQIPPPFDPKNMFKHIFPATHM